MAKEKSVLDTHNVVTSTELADILNLQLDALFADPNCANILPPLLIHGSPGLGKSSVVRTVCEQRGIEFIDVRLAQMEPCDIKGLPVPDKENHVMEWFINGSWPRNPKGKGIIFLDEITASDRSVQVAAYELVLDRRLGKLYSVPPGYLIVAAGNTSTDRAVATAMSSALANRFMHVEIKDDQESWLVWARGNNIHPAVTGFITFKPSMLFNMDNENLERGWPSPRSWERVSEMCHICKNDKLLRKMVFGLVGNRAGVEFMAFYKLNAKFANILDIMRNPDAKIVIPEQADQTYAMVSAMLYLLWRGTDAKDEAARINGFFRICLELPSSFSSMAVVAAMQGNTKKADPIFAEKLVKCPLFKDWRKKNVSTLNNKYSF